MPRLTVTVPAAVAAALEAAAPPQPPGRTGGVAALARRILCDWAGVEATDPHEQQARERRGAYPGGGRKENLAPK